MRVLERCRFFYSAFPLTGFGCRPLLYMLRRQHELTLLCVGTHLNTIITTTIIIIGIETFVKISIRHFYGEHLNDWIMIASRCATPFNRIFSITIQLFTTICSFSDWQSELFEKLKKNKWEKSFQCMRTTLLWANCTSSYCHCKKWKKKKLKKKKILKHKLICINRREWKGYKEMRCTKVKSRFK